MEDDRIAALAAAVDSAAGAVNAFEVTIAGAGAVPSPTRPRTIWLGVDDGAAELGAAAEAVEHALAGAGIEPSPRPYRAHLTLARSDGIRAGPDVARRLVEAAAARRTTFEASDVVLFETVGGGGPARYVPLHTAPLNRRPAVLERDRGETPPVLPSEPSAGDRTSVGARRKEQRPGT